MRQARLILAALAIFAAGQAGAQPQQPWYDTSLPTAQRVDALVGQMTLKEKASQMVNQSRAIPRLGIPAYDWWSEALHGVANNGYATVFPEPIGLAATFDPALIHQMAVAIGTEARVKYNMVGRDTGEHRIFQGLDFWSPNINIFRDPRWGRGQETYGEDPFLTGRMGTAFVQGMQGDDPKFFRVIATAKHYAVHSGPEPTRHRVDVQVSKHDMEDTYLPAFRQLVTEGKVYSVMCAYNRINGQPACANDFLLSDQLKNKWNFQGYIVSDCDAIADMESGHHYTKTLAEAAAASLKLGVDNDCADFRNPPDEDKDYIRYAEAVQQGLVPQKTLDDSLRRLFTARMKLGLFDPPATVSYANVPDSALMSPANRALALRTARESMVLLKNNGVLPMKRTVRNILVVGPLADQVNVLLGNYNGHPRNPVTALEGLRRQFPDAHIVYEPGTNFLHSPLPVPASALLTPDGQPGLKAEFWKGDTITGAPFLTRTDATIQFERGGGHILTPGPLALRWTGTLSVPESGTYALGLEGQKCKLWVDGQLVSDIQTFARNAVTKDLALEKGHQYQIRIEQLEQREPVIKLVWNKVIDHPLNRAVAAARKADLVIAVTGITSALEGEEMKVDVTGFSGGDRTSLDMPADEEALLKAVKATGKKLVVVLMNGSALSVNWAAAHADAILEAWYPGEEGGTAIAQTLAGDNNPSGHLPVTFYKGVDQLPPFEDYAMTGRTYRYFTGKPLYPFGHGLSYTRFRYSGLKMPASVKAGDTLGVDVTVRNSGARYGNAVAQLYLTFPQAPGMPVRALRGFTRVTLQAGESRVVHFDLAPRDLSSVTAAGDRVVAAGGYRITVGDGQPGTGAAFAAATFRVDGTMALPQ